MTPIRRRKALRGLLQCLPSSLMFAQLILLPLQANANVEPFWDAQEFFTQKGHLRYLLLPPSHYDPHRRYELWVNLHGNPGCASHAIFQYRAEARQRQVFLLAPQATGGAGELYDRPDGKQDRYRFWAIHEDRGHILTILNEVLAKYPIDRKQIVLLGFSAGCDMGWRLLAIRPELFSFFGGVANGFRKGRLPASEKGLRLAALHTPHFYAAGQADAFAGPMFEGTVRRLREYGFELKTAYPAGVGHDLPPAIKTPLLAFLDEVRARKNESKATPSRSRQSHSKRRPRKGSIASLVLVVGLIYGGLVCLRIALRRYLKGP